MRRRRLLVTRLGAAAVALLLVAAGADAATISRCAGPGGEILYTDRECPEGYRFVQELETAPERADRQPYFCEYAGVLGQYEVASAIRIVESSLAAAGQTSGEPDRARSWRACLDSLHARQRALAATAARAAPPRPPEPKAAPAPCRHGSFRTENGMTSFAVSFTNLDSAPCTGVAGYCLFHLFTGGPGDYRESGTVHFAGTIAPGETVSLGTVSSGGGPPGRSIAWSWCRIR